MLAEPQPDLWNPEPLGEGEGDVHSERLLRLQNCTSDPGCFSLLLGLLEAVCIIRPEVTFYSLSSLPVACLEIRCGPSLAWRHV